MSECQIIKIDIDEYPKCRNIWNMENNPYSEKFKKQIINGERFVYIYTVNGAFIAEGNLVINEADPDYFIPDKRIYLSHMITKKEYRNQGIGSIMLDYLINQASDMGYSEIALGVDIDNCNAIHLYKKKGFHTIIGEFEDEYGKYFKMLKRL